MVTLGEWIRPRYKDLLEVFMAFCTVLAGDIFFSENERDRGGERAITEKMRNFSLFLRAFKVLKKGSFTDTADDLASKSPENQAKNNKEPKQTKCDVL